MTLLIAILTACAAQGDAPRKPEKALDPTDPKSVAEHGIYNTRSQSSYATKFKARLTVPQGDPLDYEGASVWVSPDVLYIHYTASGGKDDRVVRAGTRTVYVCHDERETPGKCRCGADRLKQALPNVWIYNAVAGWVTREEVANPGLAQGIQNPDEILEVLSRHLAGARLAGKHLIEVPFTGADIERIMKDQAQRGSFDWAGSRASLQLQLDGDLRLQKLVCDAELKSADPNVKGFLKYASQVEIASYNKERDMPFTDARKKPIEIDKEIKDAIENTLKEKK